MLPVLVKASVSPSVAENPAVMATVAPVRLAESTSLTVRVLVIWVAASPSVKGRAPASTAASTGASLTGVMVMVRVWVLDRLVPTAPPSSTWKVTVRTRVEGLSEVLAYLIVRSAAS